MPEKEEKLKANLAMNLQYLRIRHKLSQVSLAKHLGISPRSISYYESGRYLPPAHPPVNSRLISLNFGAFLIVLLTSVIFIYIF